MHNRSPLAALLHRLDRSRDRLLGRDPAPSEAPGPDPAEPIAEPAPGPAPEAAPRPVPHQIALLAELTIPSCRRYRVEHRAEALRQLGHGVEIADWRDEGACRQALQLCDLAILYRVGAHPHVAALLEEARRLGVPVLFETDDLIFDLALYAASPAVLDRPPWERREILSGASFYRAALLACDHAIASTEPLAAALREAAGPGREVFVVENGPNHHMLWLADRILRHPLPRTEGALVIGYGSGTRTHDADLALVAPALAEVLDRFPAAELALHGDVAPAPELERFGSRVRRFPSFGVDDYLCAVATWDVSLAPLEATAFNDAKSNIKFLEAGLVGVPSVCTPTQPFRAVIEPGVNGLLAETTRDWVEALSALLESRERRRAMGERARATVLERYHPDVLAERQLRPLLDRVLSRPAGPRILVADDAPLAEDHPARLLQAREGVAVRALGVDERPDLAGAALRRSRADGLDRVGIHPQKYGVPFQYWNGDVAEGFRRVAAAWRPDVVVIGSLARLGLSLVRVCAEAGIPYIVLVRDTWWLCDPALHACPPGEACAPDADALRRDADRSLNPELVYHRYFEMRAALLGAAALVAPDGPLRDAYRGQNLPPHLLADEDLEAALARVLAGRS